MRIFVDVGSHYGETLDVALDPAWGFDQIFALEPSVGCLSTLRGFRDTRLIVENVGLAAKSAKATLYGAGLLGASVFPSKRQKSPGVDLVTEQITLVRARDWLRENIPTGAELYMKFNCEGAECDILDDLLDAGFADRLTNLYIDFDIRKVEGLTYRQADTERRLTQANVRYVTSEGLGCVGNIAVKKWLTAACSRQPAPFIERLRYELGLYAPLYVQMKRLLRVMLPPTAFGWLGHRFGRISRSKQRSR